MCMKFNESYFVQKTSLIPKKNNQSFTNYLKMPQYLFKTPTNKKEKRVV
jgi:hypothetical protein